MGYIDDTWNKLLESDFEKIDIQKTVNPSNLSQFNDAVKFFIDCDKGKEKGFYLEFSNDYGIINKKLYAPNHPKSTKQAVEPKLQKGRKGES